MVKLSKEHYCPHPKMKPYTSSIQGNHEVIDQQKQLDLRIMSKWVVGYLLSLMILVAVIGGDFMAYIWSVNVSLGEFDVETLRFIRNPLVPLLRQVRFHGFIYATYAAVVGSMIASSRIVQFPNESRTWTKYLSLRTACGLIGGIFATVVFSIGFNYFGFLFQAELIDSRYPSAYTPMQFILQFLIPSSIMFIYLFACKTLVRQFHSVKEYSAHIRRRFRQNAIYLLLPWLLILAFLMSGFSMFWLSPSSWISPLLVYIGLSLYVFKRLISLIKQKQPILSKIEDPKIDPI